MKIENFMDENYTFTKEIILNNELESSVSCEFNSKNNISEVLQSMLLFLRAAGYDYVDKLIAVKTDGDELSSDDDISEEIAEVLEKVVVELDLKKKKKDQPNLELVHNEKPEKPTDTS